MTGFDATDAEIARREHAAEMGAESDGDRAWSKYYNRAEKALAEAGFISRVNGSTIDGDESEDGFSIDGAYDAFLANVTIPSYVRMVARRRVGIDAVRRAGLPDAGVADLEALAELRPFEVVERRFTPVDTLSVVNRTDYDPPLDYRHNGVRVDRERAVDLIGERA